MSERLTEKQRRFVDWYLETGNATEAALKAGYSKKAAQQIGSENLLKPVIQKAIDRRNKEIADAKKADIDEVLTYLTSVMRGEQSDEQIASIGLGNGVTKIKRVETRVTTRDRLKAASELMKRFPRALDKEEQKLRLRKLEAELEEADSRNDDDVQIIDDLKEDADDDNNGTTQ